MIRYLILPAVFFLSSLAICAEPMSAKAARAVFNFEPHPPQEQIEFRFAREFHGAVLKLGLTGSGIERVEQLVQAFRTLSTAPELPWRNEQPGWHPPEEALYFHGATSANPTQVVAARLLILSPTDPAFFSYAEEMLSAYRRLPPRDLTSSQSFSAFLSELGMAVRQSGSHDPGADTAQTQLDFLEMGQGVEYFFRALEGNLPDSIEPTREMKRLKARVNHNSNAQIKNQLREVINQLLPLIANRFSSYSPSELVAAGRALRSMTSLLEAGEQLIPVLEGKSELLFAEALGKARTKTELAEAGASGLWALNNPAEIMRLVQSAPAFQEAYRGSWKDFFLDLLKPIPPSQFGRVTFDEQSVEKGSNPARLLDSFRHDFPLSASDRAPVLDVVRKQIHAAYQRAKDNYERGLSNFPTQRDKLKELEIEMKEEVRSLTWLGRKEKLTRIFKGLRGRSPCFLGL